MTKLPFSESKEEVLMLKPFTYFVWLFAIWMLQSITRTKENRKALRVWIILLTKDFRVSLGLTILQTPQLFSVKQDLVLNSIILGWVEIVLEIFNRAKLGWNSSVVKYTILIP